MADVQVPAEQRWLQQLAGEWEFDGQAFMEPGNPVPHRGTESGSLVGDTWVLLESRNAAGPGDDDRNLMALGYDPAKGRVVGSFISSAMTGMWIYEGTLDLASNVLTLDTEGPAMDGSGRVPYQDIIEVHGPDRRVLRSQFRSPDGGWNEFMRAEYRRRA